MQKNHFQLDVPIFFYPSVSRVEKIKIRDFNVASVSLTNF